MRRTLTASVAVVITAAASAVAGWQAAARPGSAVIVGVVVTDAARPQPVRRATVRLFGGAGTSGRLLGTDDEGRFRFDGLWAGSYSLSVSKPGFVQTFYGSKHPGRGPGVPVDVADGQRVDVTIRMLPGAVITGTVTDPQGAPAVGVTVAAVETRPVIGASLPPARETTDDLGTYRIFGLPPGDYLVSATPQIVPASDGRGGQRSGGALPLTTAAEVQWARTGGAGGVPPPPPGRLVAFAPVFYPGTTNVADAAVVRLASGEERAGVGISLRIVPMSRLAGALLDPDSKAVTSAVTVTLYPRRGDRPSPADALVSAEAIALPRANISASGFDFTGVAPGEYTIVVRTGAVQRGAAPPPGAPGTTPPVTLWNVTDITVDGNDRNDLTLRLFPGLTLSGSIALDQSASARLVDSAAFDVSLLSLNPIPGVAVPRAVISPNGTFRIASVPPGSYVVRASIPKAPAGSWILKSAILNGRDLADRPIQAAATGEEVSGLVVTLSNGGAEISGRLVDASNQPVTQYWIVAFPTDRSLWLPHARRIRSVEPAANGSFSVTDLPAGEYAIAAVGDTAPGDLAEPAVLAQLLASAFKITLAEGEKKTQDLRIGR